MKNMFRKLCASNRRGIHETEEEGMEEPKVLQNYVVCLTSFLPICFTDKMFVKTCCNFMETGLLV